MKGVLFPVLWLGGLALGILGTGYLYRAVTLGTATDLIFGLALFLPGLYIAGTVLARARLAYRAERQGGPRRARPSSQGAAR